MTLRGAVEGCKPGAEGPRGLARCRNELDSVIFLDNHFMRQRNTAGMNSYMDNRERKP